MNRNDTQSMKRVNWFCAVLLFVFSTATIAASQITFFPNELNKLSDNAAGYLINANGGNDTTLDIGDRLRGIVQIETIEGLTSASLTDLLSNPTELTAIYDVTVIDKIQLLGSNYQYVFGPTPAAIAWSNLPGPAPAAGTMFRFYEDPTRNYTRLGSPDDGDPGLSGADIGGGPFATEEMIVAVATDGAPFWDLGFTGVGTDINGQPLAGSNEGWAGNGTDNVLFIRDLTPPIIGGSFNLALNVITYFQGPALGQVPSTFGFTTGGTVAVNGSGSMLGVGNSSPTETVNTPFDFFSDMNFVIGPRPTPAPAIDIEKATNGVDADDPNAGDAPQIAIGGTVTWTYVVTNTGNEPLNNVVATDDQGVTLSCPSQPAVLNPGDSFTCTASGVAEDLNSTGFTTVPGLCGSIPNTPMYENMGKVSGNGVNSNTLVQDVDPSHYCNPPAPAIDIEKATNGIDADDPNAGDAPQIAIGGTVTWTYVVTNIGNEPLNNVMVADDQGVTLSCPSQPAVLNPGDSFTCTASGTAEDLNSTGFTTVPGLCGRIPNTPMYENMGKVSGNGVNSNTLVQDVDPSHYCNPPAPAIDIEKATNGIDADDPNAGDAPQIAIGGTVTWTYVVTNIGNEPLNNVMVADDQGVTLSCPSQPAVLNPGDSFTCTASGTAEDLNSTGFTTVPGLCGRIPNTPMYENMGKVSGNGVNSNTLVQDVDPSHYCNPPVPAIDIEKATNGIDADDPNAGDAPQIAANGTVTWTYVVTNTGNEPLNNVMVADDQGVTLSCPSQPAVLNPGDSFTCTASGVAEDLNSTGFTTVPGLCGSVPNTPMYENMGKVSGNGVNSNTLVQDVDPSHYCNPPAPAIDIEKATNGIDADDPNAGDAPQIAANGTVTWTYVVTNTGNEPLNGIVVTDDQGVSVNCPQTTLALGESMICTASGLADDLNTTGFTTVPGLCGGFPNTPMYENKGRVSNGSNSGQFVQDEDPSHYCNPPQPAIDIEKATNGIDADDPNAGDAPQVVPGGPVTWTYLVTNTGNTILNNVTVVDDLIGPVSCPKTTLIPGESMTCTASSVADNLSTSTTAVPGLCGSFPNTPMYENMGKATGQSTTGQFVQDVDPSHYCNPPQPAIKLEKLTNGFDADTRDESSTSTGVPTVPSINAGATVTWTYQVTNTGNTVLDPVIVSDDAGTPLDTSDDFCTLNAGACAVVINCPTTTLNPGQSMNCTAQRSAHDLSVFTPVVSGQCGGVPSNLYENGAVATGSPPFGPNVKDQDPSHYCNPGVCNLEVNKTCLVIPPPQPNVGTGECEKPIDVLKLEYAGGTAITGVTWYAGEVSPGKLIRSATATEVTSLNGGGVVEFNGFEVNNSPNDVQIVTTFASGPAVTSEFHLSCSDDDMDGPEDCGTVIGDGKNDDLPATSNIWTFRGTARLDGVGISCPLPPVAPTFPTATACEFTPPQSAASCSDIKDITAVSVIWNGPDGVDVVTESGEVFDDVQSGQVITFQEAGTGNDVELYLSGSVSGTSVFHVSCSDDGMDGPEDCGTAQGNGKDDDSGLINQWALEGMTGEKGVIDCAVVQGRSGAEVRYGIEVKNLNGEPVTVMITDNKLGINQTETIAANTTFQLETNPTLIVPDGTNEFVNVVNVSGQTVGGASCDASATAMLTRKPPPVQCSECKGKVTQLTLKYLGSSAATIMVKQKNKDVRYNDVVASDGEFSFFGTDKGTLGTEISVYVDGTLNTKIHTSCSQPIGPGLIIGDFEVIEAHSKEGGLICPLVPPRR